MVLSFRERHGLSGSFAAESAFLRGLGRCVGLEPIEAKLDLGLVVERLDAGDSFVYVHDKRVDEAGHTKDPQKKQRAIEGSTLSCRPCPPTGRLSASPATTPRRPRRR